MRIPLGFAVAVMLSACSPSAPAPEHPAADSASAGAQVDATTAPTNAPAEFEAAGGNVGCDYVPAGGTDTYTTPDGGPQLICDRVEPAYVRFTLSVHGAATRIDHVGDASCCSGDMLAAGAHWTGGPFACDVTQAGISCANADRRGFVLSRTEASAH
jgi:hypothetical protein